MARTDETHLDDLRDAYRDEAGREAGRKPQRELASEMKPLEFLRYCWRQLTSMRTALFLLMLLAVAAVPGSTFPQQNNDPSGVATWMDDHPTRARGWSGCRGSTSTRRSGSRRSTCCCSSPSSAACSRASRCTGGRCAPSPHAPRAAGPPARAPRGDALDAAGGGARGRPHGARQAALPRRAARRLGRGGEGPPPRERQPALPPLPRGPAHRHRVQLAVLLLGSADRHDRRHDGRHPARQLLRRHLVDHRRRPAVHAEAGLDGRGLRGAADVADR